VAVGWPWGGRGVARLGTLPLDRSACQALARPPVFITASGQRRRA